tara:strand:- start:6043 stop:6480 length:438 start_codon:yes stop_codon:yes gene_type:complete
MLIYDYILIGILISFSLIGLFLGFIKSISKFLIMIIPPFFAYIYSEKSLLIFQEEFNFYSGNGAKFLASLIVFLISYISIKLICMIIDRAITFFGLNLVNKFIGFLTGGILGIILGYILLIILYEFFNIETYSFKLINELFKIKI